MPEVSVLIPTYNRLSYLMEAIASVCAQTHKDWEAIIVDDGSTDETPTVAAQFKPPIRYIYQPNQGVSVARNRAFRESTGEFIVFLDSDDCLLPNALEVLSRALRENPTTEIVYSNGYIINDIGERVAQLSDYRQTPVEDTLEFFINQTPVDIHSTMLRRANLAALDGPFDEKMIGYEDRDLFIRLKAAGCHFLYVPEFTCCYRFHGGNKSAPKSEWAQRRRQSLIHSRMKILNAIWFDDLSLQGRYDFIHALLAQVLKGDYLAQERILNHTAFKQLPARQRSRLFYCLAAENLLDKADQKQEVLHLLKAIRLYPYDPRPYLLLGLAALGQRICSRAIGAFRRIKAGPQTVDPVSQILHAKNAA